MTVETQSVEKQYSELVSHAVRQHSDIDAAIKSVLGALEADPDLRIKLMPMFERKAVRAEVYSARGRMRVQLKYRRSQEETDEQAGIIGRVLKTLDSYMVGDRRLRYADRELLESSADTQEKQAYGHLRAAKFERAVAEPLGEGQVVEDVWTDDKIAELESECFRNGE